jgi:AraC-like DNA-binding protein
VKEFINITSISQLHQILGFSKPRHPLVSIIDYSTVANDPAHYNINIVSDFYSMSLKSPAPKSLQYGRQYYDFEEGSMFFIAPHQVLNVREFDAAAKYEGWGLFFHPDLIKGTTLETKIRKYNFFSYSVSEALHLSEEEKSTLSTIVSSIEKEYNAQTDAYSQELIVSAIDLLLTYCQRFYSRQFITRKKANNDVVANFERLLNDYFNCKNQDLPGLPTVEYFASRLNLSASYLTDLLKSETGKSTKEHIHLHLIDVAKIRLLNSNQTVSEIAYSLGFEYPQYFNRLFKSKTGMTAVAYRQMK